MITYRHHVISLVAVFLALAVGVALGGGPLATVAGDDDVAPARAVVREARIAAGYGDTFAAAVADRLYDDALADRPVAVVALPGADDASIAGLTDQVEQAGGSVTGRYDVQPALVAPSGKALVDSLGRRLAEQVTGDLGAGVADADAPTYVRLGQLLGVAAATTAEGAEPAGEAGLAVRQGLAAAELVVSPEREVARAPAVVVVLGEGGGTLEEQAVLEGLMTGLAGSAAAIVVAGDTDHGRRGGVLASLRGEPVADLVTTVDGVETTLGQVTTVLATLRRLAGEGGAFGASGADGAVPLG